MLLFTRCVWQPICPKESAQEELKLLRGSRDWFAWRGTAALCPSLWMLFRYLKSFSLVTCLVPTS